jgi:phospholipid/cholesterol/gamma-HCH transport system substrate-binding protein
MKKFFTKEVKVGILVIAGLGALIFGINFLKGVNIFEPSNSFHTKFENISGLEKTAPVYLKGYKVGQVSDIVYDFTEKESFTVIISLDEDVKIPKGYTTFELVEGLLDVTSFEILLDSAFYTEKTQQITFYSTGDFVPSENRVGMLNILENAILPKLSSVILQVDSTLLSLRAITESDEIQNVKVSLATAMSDFEGVASDFKQLSGNELPSIAKKVDKMASDFSAVGEELKDANIGNLVASIDSTMTNVQVLTEKINGTQGTLGLLLNDTTLYDNMSNTMESANSLLQDLKESPSRYVHFSLFGRKK